MWLSGHVVQVPHWILGKQLGKRQAMSRGINCPKSRSSCPKGAGGGASDAGSCESHRFLFLILISLDRPQSTRVELRGVKAKPQVKTVSVRLPEDVWRRVRMRSLQRGESALAYASRCLSVCLGVAETGIARGGITAVAVEPPVRELTYEEDPT